MSIRKARPAAERKLRLLSASDLPCDASHALASAPQGGGRGGRCLDQVVFPAQADEPLSLGSPGRMECLRGATADRGGVTAMVRHSIIALAAAGAMANHSPGVDCARK
jgi:hypothetical protein